MQPGSWFRLRFGMRAMLVTVAIIAVAATLVGRRVKRAIDQKRIVASVLAAGGTVRYDYQEVEAAHPYSFNPKAQPRGSTWLRGLLGGDLFEEVVSVSFRDKPVTDEHLKELTGLRRLKILTLTNTQVTNNGLKHLARLPALENLSLSKTQVTSDGLAHLRGLKNLQLLGLWNTNVDDSGLEHLAVHTKLKNLVLDGTQVTDAGLRRLQGLTELEHWLGLTDTQVTDDGIQCLGQLTKLKHLNLRRTHVTKDGVKMLQRSLPDADISYGP